MAFYLRHEPSDQLAHHLATGEHDAAKTNRVENAARFETWGAASEYSQNFGPDWHVEEIGGPQWTPESARRRVGGTFGT